MMQVQPARTRKAIETVVYVPVEGQAAGYITLATSGRSAEAIRVLKEERDQNLLLTGDNGRVTRA